MDALLFDNNDALRAVLVRICAADHPSLRLTCRRFREIVDSPEFRQERCESGYAEIKAAVWTPFEHYKEGNEEEDEALSESDSFFQDYYDDFGFSEPGEGYQRNRARLFVDGRKAGEAFLALLPRNKPHLNFHSMADAVSQDLQSIGCLFFDKKGKPRLKSIEQALGSNDSRASLLYIESFKLDDPAHRTTPWAGAKALRSLLLETTLKDRWSVAMYIPEAKAQFSKEDVDTCEKQRWYDRKRSFAEFTGELKEEESEKEKKRVKDWEERCDTLTKRDMRQFLQAGFEQAKDALQESSCFHVFIVPSYIDKPMLTNDETMSIAIVEKRPAKEAPSGDALRLLELMKTSCAERTQITHQIHRSQETLDSPQDHPLFRQVTQIMQPHRAEFQRSIEIANDQQQDAQQRRDAVSAMLSVLNDDSQAGLIRHMVDQSPEGSTREGLIEHLNSIIAECDEMINRTRNILEDFPPRMNQLFQEAEQEALEAITRQAREEISKHKQSLQDQDTHVQSKVAELIAASGPDIVSNSDALHACAYNLEPGYIKTLMSFVPDSEKQKVINSIDHHGSTVLTTAAASQYYSASSIGNRLKTCEAVIDLGGDKNIRNASGLTAFGAFRKSNRSSRDLYGAFGADHSGNPNFVAMNSTTPAMKALLRPLGGATAADDAFLEVHGEDGHDEEEEEDDDSIVSEQEDSVGDEDLAVDDGDDNSE